MAKHRPECFLILARVFSPTTLKWSPRSLFNQNSNRSNREKWSTSKGAPVFSVGPNRSIEFWTQFWLNGSRPWAFETGIPLTIGIRNFRRDPFNKNFRKFRSKTQWISSVQPEKCQKNWSTFWGGPLFPVGPVEILVEWIAPLAPLTNEGIWNPVPTWNSESETVLDYFKWDHTLHFIALFVITYLVNSAGCYFGIIISLCVYWLLALKKEQAIKNQNRTSNRFEILWRLIQIHPTMTKKEMKKSTFVWISMAQQQGSN